MSAHHGIKRVVLLHGVGGTGASMRPIAEHLGRGVETYSPDGPAAFDMGAGRQWFSVLGVTEANRPARVAAALPAFAATIARFGDLHDTVLIGFSQGAIMALHAAAAGLRPAGVIAIAGRLSGPVDQQPVWPKITLLHGTADQIMPPDFARATEGWLRAAGAEPALELFDGLGHALDFRILEATRRHILRA